MLDHQAFRATIRRFIDEEIAPYHYEWEGQRGLPRELWRKAGQLGFLCCDVRSSGLQGDHPPFYRRRDRAISLRVGRPTGSPARAVAKGGSTWLSLLRC